MMPARLSSSLLTSSYSSCSIRLSTLVKKILGAFTTTFGLTITVGQEQGKFLYNLRKLMKIPKNGQEKILNVSVPRNHEFLESRLLWTTHQEDRILFEGALVYFIDVTQYLKWIGKWHLIIIVPLLKQRKKPSVKVSNHNLFQNGLEPIYTYMIHWN